MGGQLEAERRSSADRPAESDLDLTRGGVTRATRRPVADPRDARGPLDGARLSFLLLAPAPTGGGTVGAKPPQERPSSCATGWRGSVPCGGFRRGIGVGWSSLERDNATHAGPDRRSIDLRGTTASGAGAIARGSHQGRA